MNHTDKLEYVKIDLLFLYLIKAMTVIITKIARTIAPAA